MGERVKDEARDVLVGQGIENVFALAAAGEQVLRTQNAEALGNGGDLFAGGGGDLADTGFALGEHGQGAQAGRIAHGAKDAGGCFQSGVVDRRQSEAAVGRVVGGAGDADRGCFCVGRHQLNNYSNDSMVCLKLTMQKELELAGVGELNDVAEIGVVVGDEADGVGAVEQVVGLYAQL
jgi:hypothetical protein